MKKKSRRKINSGLNLIKHELCFLKLFITWFIFLLLHLIIYLYILFIYLVLISAGLGLDSTVPDTNQSISNRNVIELWNLCQ